MSTIKEQDSKRRPQAISAPADNSKPIQLGVRDADKAWLDTGPDLIYSMRRWVLEGPREEAFVPGRGGTQFTTVGETMVEEGGAGSCR